MKTNIQSEEEKLEENYSGAGNKFGLSISNDSFKYSTQYTAWANGRRGRRITVSIIIH